MTIRIAQIVRACQHIASIRYVIYTCAAPLTKLFSCSFCGAGAQAGECQANPAYMMDSCKKSCGACHERPKEARRSGQRPSSGSSSSSSGGGSSSAGSRAGSRGPGGDASSGSRAAADKPATAADLLGDGAYALHVGKIAGKEKALHTARMDLKSARAWCDARGASCAGFTVAVAKPGPLPSGPQAVTFRRAAPSVTSDVGHVAFVRTAADSGTCAEAAGPGCVKATDAKKSSGGGGGSSSGGGGGGATSGESYSSGQMAAYYLRAAEIYSYDGRAKAQDVIDMVRAALPHLTQVLRSCARSLSHSLPLSVPCSLPLFLSIGTDPR